MEIRFGKPKTPWEYWIKSMEMYSDAGYVSCCSVANSIERWQRPMGLLTHLVAIKYSSKVVLENLGHTVNTQFVLISTHESI